MVAFKDLSLGDPSYCHPQSVDLLLGADILPLVFLNGRATGQTGEPIAIETIFGWILMRPVDTHNHSTTNTFCTSAYESLDNNLKKFWELEELTTVRHLSLDDHVAEEIYVNTTTRTKSGRFMVTLPFRTPHPI